MKTLESYVQGQWQAGAGRLATLHDPSTGEAIAETGSISAAARSLGMSYRRAWKLVDTMNRCFQGDLVVTAAGGRGGGGTKVTLLGFEVLRRYRDMEAKAEVAVRREIAEFADLLTRAARRD